MLIFKCIIAALLLVAALPSGVLSKAQFSITTFTNSGSQDNGGCAGPPYGGCSGPYTANCNYNATSTATSLPVSSLSAISYCNGYGCAYELCVAQTWMTSSVVDLTSFVAVANRRGNLVLNCSVLWYNAPTNMSMVVELVAGQRGKDGRLWPSPNLGPTATNTTNLCGGHKPLSPPLKYTCGSGRASCKIPLSAVPVGQPFMLRTGYEQFPALTTCGNMEEEFSGTCTISHEP